MSKLSSLPFASLLLIFGFLNAAAQTSPFDEKPAATCQVQVKAYSLEALKDTSPKTLKGARILLKDSGGRIITPVDKKIHLYNLSVADYTAQAVAAGYKTSEKLFRPDCGNPWLPVGTVTPENLFLLKGDSREVIDGTGLTKKAAVTGTTPEKPDGPFVIRFAPPGASAASSQVINGKALKLVEPEYPPAALAVRAAGTVKILVTLDEFGDVISARPISGHPLLRAVTLRAAYGSKFAPTTQGGFPVKTVGVILYNFMKE